jgi:hypothetical protein
MYVCRLVVVYSILYLYIVQIQYGGSSKREICGRRRRREEKRSQLVPTKWRGT